MPNIRLVNSRREEGHRYICDLTDVPRLQFIFRDLATLRRLEPDADWHMEDRKDHYSPWTRSTINTEPATPIDHMSLICSRYQALTDAASS